MTKEAFQLPKMLKGIVISINFTNNLNTLKQLSLIGSSIPFYVERLNNHDKTLDHIKKTLKIYYKKRKSLKLVMVSGIFSEKHSEAIQIINF